MPQGIKRPETAEELWDRFWPKVDASGDCWAWTGSFGSHGYGQFRDSAKNRMTTAHRVAWTLLVGEIPRGSHIDHLCRNLGCVNPDHLEVVTPAENYARGFGVSFRTHREGVCQRGHRDLYARPSGTQYCRTCQKIRRFERKLGTGTKKK